LGRSSRLNNTLGKSRETPYTTAGDRQGKLKVRKQVYVRQKEQWAGKNWSKKREEEEKD